MEAGNHNALWSALSDCCLHRVINPNAWGPNSYSESDVSRGKAGGDQEDFGKFCSAASSKGAFTSQLELIVAMWEYVRSLVRSFGFLEKLEMCIRM